MGRDEQRPRDPRSGEAQLKLWCSAAWEGTVLSHLDSVVNPPCLGEDVVLLCKSCVTADGHPGTLSGLLDILVPLSCFLSVLSSLSCSLFLVTVSVPGE
jgi:hypothetical protein